MKIGDEIKLITNDGKVVKSKIIEIEEPKPKTGWVNIIKHAPEANFICSPVYKTKKEAIIARKLYLEFVCDPVEVSL
jgi:hypothetical protein